MAREKKEAPAVDVSQEKKRLKAERRNLQRENKAQRKAAKARAKEISKQEAALDEESEGGTISAVAVTIFIVLIWLAILCLLIKLDVGGFGSNVLRPVLKDVPVLNLILPKDETTETTDQEAYGGYTSLREAVEQIKALELQIEQLQTIGNADE